MHRHCSASEGVHLAVNKYSWRDILSILHEYDKNDVCVVQGTCSTHGFNIGIIDSENYRHEFPYVYNGNRKLWSMQEKLSL